MPYRVHAGMKAVQAASPQPEFDCLPTSAIRRELLSRHHPMLPLGELA